MNSGIYRDTTRHKVAAVLVPDRPYFDLPPVPAAALPGTEAAQRHGCTCPISARQGKRLKGEKTAGYDVDRDCPIHQSPRWLPAPKKKGKS